jgi:mannan endo-1,4-beta-mannosidase
MILRIRKINMKSGILLNCVAVMFLSAANIALGAAPVDPLATQKTKDILNYFYTLPNGTSNRIIIGQFGEDTGNVTKIYQSSGKYVGMIGRDYKWDSLTAANNEMIEYSNAGGLVTVSDHFDNPASGGNAWDTSYVDLTQVATSGASSNNKLRAELDRIAGAMATLQDNNVVVLFRPLHEMNGSWFWWGGKYADSYKTLWRYIFNYMTQVKGLHNLLWVYSPNAYLDMTYYPGDQYVDIVGVDLYGTGGSIGQLGGYGQATKPFAITEFGMCQGGVTWTPSACQPASLSNIIPSLKQSMPKTIFIMFWNGVYALDYNSNLASLMNDSWAMTREEILVADLPKANSPPAPANLRVVVK